MPTRRVKYVPPQLKADATLTQINPVSGTKYTVLATTANARIISACASVTWTVQPNPLQIHCTVDGQNQPEASQANPVSTTYYEIHNYPATANWAMSNSFTVHRAFLIEGRSIKIEAETTGGTVSALNARVKYGAW